VGKSAWPLEGFLALDAGKVYIEYDHKSPSRCSLTYKPFRRNVAFIISNNKHTSQIYIRHLIRETHDAFQTLIKFSFEPNGGVHVQVLLLPFIKWIILEYENFNYLLYLIQLILGKLC